jgi:hypothetical protein
MHYNPKAITKTEYSTLILNKREPVTWLLVKFAVMHLNTGSLLFNIRVEYSVFCSSLRVIMNMNKPPDETLKQGRE